MASTSIFLLSGLGFAAASILAVASKVLHVKEDPRIAEVEACLPGANCGGCGYPGCSAAAAAVVAGEASPELCVAGGMETATAVARVMGMSVAFKEPKVAAGICTGGKRARELYDYNGVEDCRAMAMLYGGDKICGMACLGKGSCVKACSFGAIEMSEEGLPVVNRSLCVACGQCVEACPTGAIRVNGLSSELLHMNQLDDCLAPCMQKCPAQLDVRTMIQQIKKNEMGEALLTLKKRIALPGIVGRICPHGCETICRRQIVDEGIAINSLERHVADWEMESGGRVPVSCNPANGHRVAVVGGGAAGLSCAFYLRRLGYEVHVFDKQQTLGGMVRHAIPDYRVPQSVSEWEVQGILDLGVIAEPGTVFGQDITLESLRNDGFEVTFVATGAWKTPALGIPGEESAQCVNGIEFLTTLKKNQPDLEGKRLVIVGDTNAAMDVARSAGRLHAASVVVLTKHIKRKMSANNLEIDRAAELGTSLLFKTTPTAIEAGADGLTVRYVSTEYKDPKKATGEPKPVEGTEASIQCDLVVNCADRVADLAPFTSEDGECEMKLTKKGTLDANKETLQTAVPDVFIGGELYRGRGPIVQAVSDGRVAARSIHMLITTGKVEAPENAQLRVIPETILKGMKVEYSVPRVQIPEIPVEERRSTFHEEVSKALDRASAEREASRCLRCGLTCYDASAGAQYAGQPGVKSLLEEQED
ncbi:RnfABCDGE type electron transport complex subunit B [Desulfobaculum bizertense]|uniref:Ion-translocating oxidoreductase complex subunit B n=1 Tax=Desulfobaculum bizertense DSM 18034 TaxID=1121442 RepID=A0A1T4VUE4_9BACT|nr:RnfABCDGE type electron transport complex subunit B [Desulfobaculum bizertense]SKA68475.1 electron transport complex, RnfABCDGE type, B subunit [Desulfobaculum bizertense DSM 18034]